MSEEIKDEVNGEEKKEKKKSSKKSDRVSELEKELAAVNDQMLRLAAEYANFKQRTQREKEAAYGDAKAATISDFLAVADNFERALANENGSFEDIRKGVEMISNQFDNALQKNSVERFGKVGDGFDPNIHSDVMHVDDDSLGENVIAEVFSKGYRMGDRIIRHAVVKVAN